MKFTQPLLLLATLSFSLTLTSQAQAICIGRNATIARHLKENTVKAQNFNSDFIERIKAEPYQIEPDGNSLVAPNGKEYLMLCTHGLSDSPYYMSGIAKTAADSGLKVRTIPLSGHFTMKRRSRRFDTWQEDIRCAVNRAISEGYQPVLCGYSTGGVASILHILKNPNQTSGFYGFAPAVCLQDEKEGGQLHGDLADSARGFAENRPRLFTSIVKRLGNPDALTHAPVKALIAGYLGINDEKGKEDLVKAFMSLRDNQRSEEAVAEIEEKASGKRDPILTGFNGLNVSILASKVRKHPQAVHDLPISINIGDEDETVDAACLEETIKEKFQGQGVKINHLQSTGHSNILFKSVTPQHKFEKEFQLNAKRMSQDIKNFVNSLPIKK